LTTLPPKAAFLCLSFL